MSYFLLIMDIREILNRNNFRFNKSLGQNFITDGNLLSSIVNDGGITSEDTVLEIGAGAGTLTARLCERAKKVVTFEIDRNLKPILFETLKGFNNCQVVFQDIMKTSMEEINSLLGDNYKIVANLPYYITTPIIMFFIENKTCFESMSIMVQKEVADRLVARESSKEYGAITVAINAFADTQITRIVKRDMFFPKPNVDSAIVRIDAKNKYDIQDRILFKKLYRCAFAMRRKTLVNNLVSGFSLSRETAEEILSSCGFDISIRGEALSIADFYNLYKKLFSKQ